MGIEKERELFLAHMRSIGSAVFMFDLDEDGNFDDMSMAYAWSAWQAAKAQAVPDGFVLIPRECPDPIFADKLFDHLCEKAHGEFGDDQMIFFSDIDESAIWQLMLEAQEPADDN